CKTGWRPTPLKGSCWACTICLNPSGFISHTEVNPFSLSAFIDIRWMRGDLINAPLAPGVRCRSLGEYSHRVPDDPESASHHGSDLGTGGGESSMPMLGSGARSDRA